MAKLGDNIPNHPINVSNLAGRADIFRASKTITIQEKKALRPILDDISDRLSGTDGKMGLRELQTVQRNINDVISRELDGKASTDLMALKKGIQNDLDDFSEQVSGGVLVDHNGTLINSTDLSRKLEQNLVDIARQKRLMVPDQEEVVRYLRGNGAHSSDYSKTDAHDLNWWKRASAKYEEITGLPVPMKQAPEAVAGMSRMQTENEQIRNILKNASPADDAAAHYRAYNKFAKEEYFDRFGNEASGTQTQLSNIPRAFTTPEGADDLILSVGPRSATQLMDQHFSQELLGKANPVTGEIKADVAENWLKKNHVVLDKYGLTGKYRTVADAQRAVEEAQTVVEQFNRSAAGKMLNADPKQAIAAAFSSNPKNTARVAQELLDQVSADPQAVAGLQSGFKDFIIDSVETAKQTISGDSAISPAGIRKQLSKFDPAMRVLYADSPERFAALKNIQEAVEIQNRSAASPLGGGSDTAEKISPIGVASKSVASLLGVLLDHTPVIGGTIRLSKLGLKSLSNLNQQEVDNLVARAMYDPDLAKTLIMAARGEAPTQVARRINHHLLTMGIVRASSKNEKNPP